MRLIFFIFIAFLVSCYSFAQVPQSFKYQAVVRGNTGNILVNQLVSFQLSILKDNPNGNVVYSERQNLSTNAYGIVNINVGTGTIISGDFTTIAWEDFSHFIKVEFDAAGGNNFQFMGTSQILSVPYALYAESAGSAANDNDTNPTNELQAIGLSNDTLYLSNGGEVYLGDYIDNTDGQTLSLTGNNTLNISGGNSIVLSQGLADLDADPTNEIQNLSLNSNTLSISGGNSVNLQPDGDSNSTNEIQSLSINNDVISISGANSITLPPETPDADSDPTNELQTLSISNDSIHISQGNSISIITKPYSFEYPHGFDGELVFYNATQTNTYTVPNGKVLYVTSALNAQISVDGINYLDPLRNSFSLLPCFGPNTVVEITTGTYGPFCGLLMDEKPGITVVNFKLGGVSNYVVPIGKTFYMRSGYLAEYSSGNNFKVNGIDVLPNQFGQYAYITNQFLIFPESTFLSKGGTEYGYTGYLK